MHILIRDLADDHDLAAKVSSAPARRVSIRMLTGFPSHKSAAFSCPHSLIRSTTKHFERRMLDRSAEKAQERLTIDDLLKSRSVENKSWGRGCKPRAVPFAATLLFKK